MIAIEENEKNVVSDKLKTQIKNFAKKVGRKVLVISLPTICVLVFLAAITWYIFLDEGWWQEDERGNPSTYTKNVKIDTSQGIILQDSKMELVKQGLRDIGYLEDKINSMTEAEMIKELNMEVKLKKKVTSIEACTEAEILWCTSKEYSKYLKEPKDLDYLLKAEVVTQYPKIDQVPEDKLNGVVRFVRTDTDGDGEPNIGDTNGDGILDIYDLVDIQGIRNKHRVSDMFDQEEMKEKQKLIDKEINEEIKKYSLTFLDKSEFDAMVAAGDKTVFKHFTMDPEDQSNIIIPIWRSESGSFESNNPGGHSESSIQAYDSRLSITGSSDSMVTASFYTYQITTMKINYKDMVKKYTLPFEYLWALLVMGESDEFVLNLAQLAYDAQMVVGLYDSITTTVTTNLYEYTEQYRENTITTEDPGGTFETGWIEQSFDYYDKFTLTVKEDTVLQDLMYADTWVVEVLTGHQRVQTEEHHTLPVVTMPDGEWQDNGSYTRQFSYAEEEIDEETGISEEKIIYVTEEHIKQKRIANQTYTTTIDIYYDKYERVKMEVKEKVDIRQDTELNFVKLLRADEKANALLFKPINVVWLTDILKVNVDTVDTFPELSEFLINKAKNPDDKSLTFDFSIFEPEEFISLGSGGQGSGGSVIGGIGIGGSNKGDSDNIGENETIDPNVTDELPSDAQQRIIEVAKNSAKYGITPEPDMCLKWVWDVYRKAGIKTEPACCARCGGYKYGVSKDFSNLPVGAVLYGYSNSGAGKTYGHVGIYIGNGQVMDNPNGSVVVRSLSNWQKTFPNGCWGWASTTDSTTTGLINKGSHN